jgi:hypothetical protein
MGEATDRNSTRLTLCEDKQLLDQRTFRRPLRTALRNGRQKKFIQRAYERSRLMRSGLSGTAEAPTLLLGLRVEAMLERVGQASRAARNCSMPRASRLTARKCRWMPSVAWRATHATAARAALRSCDRRCNRRHALLLRRVGRCRERRRAHGIARRARSHPRQRGVPCHDRWHLRVRGARRHSKGMPRHAIHTRATRPKEERDTHAKVARL